VTPTNAVDPVVEGAAVSRAAATAPISVASAAAIAAEAPVPTAATRVAPRIPQRPTAAAPAAPLDFVNTAVTTWFDSVSNWLSGLPANPVSELLQGGLLLVRRTFFNQAPTVNPYEYMRTPSGQLVGTIGAVDPETDPLTYRVVDAPTFGTVQIGSDGTYTYTPGEGYTGTDAFTVGVDDARLNVLAPRLGSSPTVASVKVGDTLPGDERYANLVTILNLTGQRIKVTDVRKESGYEDNVEAAPPVGTVVEPGASVFLKLRIEGGDTFIVYTYDTRVVFEPCNTTDCSVTASAVPWIANLTTTGGDDSLGVCEVGECDMYRITPGNPLGIATLRLLPHR
jgi:hypothetical protein